MTRRACGTGLWPVQCGAGGAGPRPAAASKAASALCLFFTATGLLLGAAAVKKPTPKPAPAKKTVTSAQAKKSTTTGKKTTSSAAKRRRTPVVPAMSRQDAMEKVSDALNAGDALNGSYQPIDNPAALASFFEHLKALRSGEQHTVHVLHYGDSHTASDDFPGTLREAFQAEFGNGGPGYSMPGRPFPGYRRYDVASSSSKGFTTEGTLRNRGDGLHGLGGVSITAKRFGETATLESTGERAELYFLQQPGGGNLDIWLDDVYHGTVSSDGDRKTVAMTLPGEPGPHRYLFRTSTADPVRLLGTVVENSRGISWEAAGINGAQASIILDWDDEILSTQIAARNPALIVLAYGTNEASNRGWDAAAYQASLAAVIARLRGPAPKASILIVGPPDYRVRSLMALTEVIDVQRRVARELGCAFWDWREHMGGAGSMRPWFYAGLAASDQVHLSSAGYQMIGKALFQDLMHVFQGYSTTAKPEVDDVASRPNQ